MQKLSGRICDSCNKLFYAGDNIYELCQECFNSVWCVINLYEDGSKELSSIHHTKEGALHWVEKSSTLISEMNIEAENKIVDQEVTQWCVF